MSIINKYKYKYKYSFGLCKVVRINSCCCYYYHQGRIHVLGRG